MVQNWGTENVENGKIFSVLYHMDSNTYKKKNSYFYEKKKLGRIRVK